MSKITPQTIINSMSGAGVTEIFDIMNAIRNSGSEFYKQFVPEATAENIAAVGAGVLSNPQTQNEFINALVNRIGLVVIRHVTISNPLSQFKSSTMSLGRNIQEIFTDLARTQLYDVEKSETEVFKREIPDVKVLYHELNRQEKYQQTIEEETLRQAFISWERFGSFTSSIIQAMYNKSEFDEYKWMKMLIANDYSKGHFHTVPLGYGTSVIDSELIEKARATALKMTLPMGSRKYNRMSVHTRTSMEDLFVIMDADTAADVDVNVLASAFNMDKAQFLGNRIILDELPINPYTGEKIALLLIDRSYFMVFDNLLKMTNIYNPNGLYWNYWLHVWQIMSTSGFANAVAITTGPVAPVTRVTFSPQIGDIEATGSKEVELIIHVPEGMETYKGDVAITLAGDGDLSKVSFTQDATNPALITITTDGYTGSTVRINARVEPEGFGPVQGSGIYTVI